MKLTRNRKMHHFLGATEGIFGRNIVLVGGLLLPYIIMPAVSLKAAVALTVAMLFSVVFGMIVSRLLAGQGVWLRYIAVTLAALGGIVLSRFAIRFISSEIFDTLGIYLPLMAVNSVVVLYAAQRSNNDTPKRAALFSLATVLGFGMVACAVGIVRELLLAGTVWGISVAAVNFPAANTVFFGFILLAFFGAAVQAARRTIIGINLRLDNPTAEDLLRREEERMVD